MSTEKTLSVAAPETATDDDTPRIPRRNKYFGYACVRSLQLRDKLLTGSLSVDDMLDVTASVQLTCPVHKRSCQCQNLESHWVSDVHGRLALKLFLKHLEGETLRAFKRLVAANRDRISVLKELACEHPKLLAKIELLALYS